MEIGSPVSRSRTRSAVRPSRDSRHVTSRTSTGAPPSAWVWHVVNRREAAKSGCTTIPMRPPSPETKRSPRSASTRVTRAPARSPDTSESRPGRSETSAVPSGRNPTSQPCSSPPATTSTSSSGSTVLRGAGLGVAAVAAVGGAVGGTSPTLPDPPAHAARGTASSTQVSSVAGVRSGRAHAPSSPRGGRRRRVRRPPRRRRGPPGTRAMLQPRPVRPRRMPSAAHRARASSSSGAGRLAGGVRDPPPGDVAAVRLHDRPDLPRADADDGRDVPVGHDASARDLLHGPQHPLHDDVVHPRVCRVGTGVALRARPGGRA